MERDLTYLQWLLRELRISTHTLTWSVTLLKFKAPASSNNFNSHAHVERDPGYPIQERSKDSFQLTRSRGAWPAVFVNDGLIGDISTHTLTWSVTLKEERRMILFCISTHTLTWSVTNLLSKLQSLIRISTHTLTWSVTFKKMTGHPSGEISTHTLTWSVTKKLLII